ncbi:hypothetical protein M9H77_00242 [Catharanthus roseus]|nr:hypothetical protein M9H77_00242 [Catharanthus roseus]
MVGDLETWARRHRHLAPAVLSGHGFRRAAWRGGGELDAEEGAGAGSPRPPSFSPVPFSVIASSLVSDAHWSEISSSSDNVAPRELCSDRVGRSDPCLRQRLPILHASSFAYDKSI